VRRQGLVLGGAAVALCAWCGWASVYHRSTGPAETTWAFSLAAVLAVDLALWRGRRRMRLGWRLQPVAEPWPRPGRGGRWLALRGLAPWIILFAVALAWDVLGLDTGPHEYHLTISALAQAYRPLNAALLLVWMLVGIGYAAARARTPIGTEGIPASPIKADPERPAPGTALGAGVVTLGGHPVVPGLLLPSSPAAGVAFWIAVPIAALLVDLAARRSHGRVARAEELARFVSTPLAANVALIAVWVFAGYHLFAR
jgi:hypothetical protein